MNRLILMTFASATAAGLVGAGLGGCVSGDIPAQQKAGADGSTSGDGAASTEGGAQGDATSGDGGGSSSGSSSGGSGGGSGSGSGGDAGGSSGGADGGSSSGGNLDAGGATDSPFLPDVPSIVTPDGATVPCIARIDSFYVLRGDGSVVVPGTTTSVLDAASALPLRGVAGVQGGAFHGCAALANGTVACWQTDASYGNLYGQLGNGTTSPSAVTYRSTPVLTAPNTPLTNVVALATAGQSTLVNGRDLISSCAVTGDQKLWCWGDLTWIVNNGTTLHSAYAQAITLDGMNALTGVIQAAFAASGACAVVRGSPNSVWCWGYNAGGELAQGDAVNRQYPIKVLGLTAPTKVVMANSYFSDNTVCALDGENVRCWGINVSGAAGVNSATNPIPTPTLVVTQTGAVLGGVTDIEPGTATFAALRTDQTVWTWGSGSHVYAGNYGITNVVATGYAGAPPRFLTSDAVYHNGMTTVSVNCNPL